MKRFNQAKGVTLVELLVAVFILSISSISIYTVFRTATVTYSKSGRQLEMMQNARTILGQITRELQGAAFNQNAGISFVGYNTDNGIMSGSTKDEVHFVAAIPNSGDWDLCEVGYWLKGEDNLLQRCFAVNPDFDFTNNGGSNSRDLGYNVIDLQLTYYYRDLNLAWTESTSWNSNIDSVSNYDVNGTQRNPDGLPDAVKVSLTVQDDLGKEIAEEFSTMIYLKNSN